MQDNTQMNNPTLRDVLIALCKQRPSLLKKDGSINHNELARKTGVNQPTITRILGGESKRPRWTNVSKIAAAFDLTEPQILGIQKIPGLFEGDEYEYSVTDVLYVNHPRSLDIDTPLPDGLNELDEASLVEWILDTIPDLSPHNRLSIAQAALSGLPKDALPSQ